MLQINRNWRPGAIPKSVAVIMERTRALCTSKDKLTDSLPDKIVRSSAAKDKIKPKATSSPAPLASSSALLTSSVSAIFRSKTDRPYSSNSNRHRTGRPVGADVLQKRNDNGAPARQDRPVMLTKKHGDQYSIAVNPMPYRDGNGKLAWPVDTEPVHLRVERKKGERDAAVLRSPAWTSSRCLAIVNAARLARFRENWKHIYTY